MCSFPPTSGHPIGHEFDTGSRVVAPGIAVNIPPLDRPCLCSAAALLAHFSEWWAVQILKPYEDRRPLPGERLSFPGEVRA